LKVHGIRLLIEPINTRDIPGYFLNTQAQARRIIEHVRSDNLFLQMDLYHCQVMEGDLAEKIKANFELIRHFQIAGNPGRHELDVGEINYPYLFQLIDELGYQGWIGCEYRPRGETVAGLGWARRYGIGPRA
jgi:hydroxypyruvate isomerase